MSFGSFKTRLQRHRETLTYTVSNVTLAGATFLGSFVCARLLEPRELGAFQTAQLIIFYLVFLPLGTVNGFNRQYPYLLGKGEAEAANLVSRAAYSVGRIAALVAALVALGQFIFFWKTSGDPALIFAAGAMILVAALNPLNLFQKAILTGRQAFGSLARIQFVLAVATLGFLPLVWKFRVPGQCLRLILIAALLWILCSWKTKGARNWHWDSQVVISLVKRGIPILAIGYFYSVFSVADRTLVAWVKGTEAVGHYALAGLAIAAIQSVYTPLAVAMYSKANHTYGRTHSVASLVRPFVRFLILVTVSVVPLALLIYFSMPLVVPLLLPKYVAGIHAGQIACIAGVAFCYCGTSFILNVTGHNRIYVVFMACAVAAFFLVGFSIAKPELTLERVAWLRTAISVCVCLLTNGYVAFYLSRGRRREAHGRTET